MLVCIQNSTEPVDKILLTPPTLRLLGTWLPPACHPQNLNSPLDPLVVSQGNSPTKWYGKDTLTWQNLWVRIWDRSSGLGLNQWVCAWCRQWVLRLRCHALWSLSIPISTAGWQCEAGLLPSICKTSHCKLHVGKIYWRSSVLVYTVFSVTFSCSSLSSNSEASLVLSRLWGWKWKKWEHKHFCYWWNCNSQTVGQMLSEKTDIWLSLTTFVHQSGQMYVYAQFQVHFFLDMKNWRRENHLVTW